MAEQAPPRRPDIAASKLRAPTRTSYFNNFFVLRTDVVLNGQPAEIGCSGSSELTLSCRYFPLPGEYSAAKPSVSYPAISGKVDEILKKHGVFHVENFFCGDVPLFQVTFSSEYGLKQFLKNKKKMEQDLAALFSEALLPSRQPGAPAINIPSLVNATLFLMSPDSATKDCRPTEVTLANHSTCMALWKESEVFDFGDVFRVFRLDPTKLPDEGEIKISTVLSEIYEVNEWVGLGLHLDIERHDLNIIAQDHWNQTRPCKQSMLDLWERMDKASWSALVRALCAIGRTALAKKIAYKYGATLPPVLFRADQELSSADQEQQEPALSTGACKVPSQQEPPAQSHLLSSIERSDHLLEEKMTSVETVADSKTKALENYQSVRRRLSAVLSNVDQLHKDKTTLMKQLDSREKALRIVKATNRKKGDQDDIIQILKQDIRQSKELVQQKDREIATITAEANDLKTQLQKSTKQLESAASKLSKLKNEREALSSDLESKRQELEKEQYRSLFKDDTITDIRGELAALRAEATTKAEQTGELKGKLSAKSEEVEYLKKALHKAEQGKSVLPEHPSPAAILQQQLLQAMETTDLRVKLATAEEGRQEVERQLGALQRQVQLIQDEIKGKQQKTLPTSFEWRRCRDTPVRVRGATAVVINGRAYIRCNTVYNSHALEYTPERDMWVELPKPPVKWFDLAVLNNQLVLVGGKELSTERQTNNIAVFEPNTRQWVQAYPPMPTARLNPSVIVYQHYLIVAGEDDDDKKAGGDDDDRKSVSTVEVLDSVNKKWCSAEQVPIKCCLMTPVVISDTAYLLGGRSDDEQTTTVLAVSLPALISKATSQPQEVNTPTSWKMLPDSPLYCSTPFTSHGMLLTAGGQDESEQESSHIYCYDPVTNQWEKVGDLPNPRFMCSCAVLPSTELLVVGGLPYTNWTSVHKATIQWK